MILLLALLILMASAFAWEWGNPLFTDPTLKVMTCNRPPAQDLGWFALGFAAISLGVAINSVMTILSGILGERVRNFAKEGVWAFFENALIISIFASMMVVIQPYAEQNIDTARAYTTIIRNTVIVDFGMILSATTLLSLHTNVNPNIKPFQRALGISLTLQLAPMFRPIYDTLGILLQLLATSIISWFAHEFVLCIIKDSALHLLIPAGFFLRAFGLRGGGNALIGIGFALYLVYPFLLIQTGEVIKKQIENDIRAAFGSTSTGGFINCIDRPICCLGNADPPDLTDPRPYIANGDDSTVEGRLLVEKINQGPLTISLNWNRPISTGAFCAYNTLLRTAWINIKNALTGGETAGVWSLTKSVATGIGIYALTKLLNIQFIAALFMIPATSFTIQALYETTYFLFIVTILLPIFNIFITITLAKEIAKVLGTEIDLTSLEKLI
ncbi:MAG: hypothetical protein QXT25_02075 [Candidatus Anstonellaceae archaeon]